MKKEWLNPELMNLNSINTEEETCYCEEGAVLAYGITTWHQGGGYRPGYGPGHHHRPPHQGGQCPNNPKPQPPEDVTNS